MTDPDVDQRLRSAGAAFRDTPVPDVAIQWPSSTRKRGLLAPLAIAAAVALIVTGVAVGLGFRHNSGSAPAAPVSPAPVVPDPNFAVAAPPGFIGDGGPAIGPINASPACAISSLASSATTRVTGDGLAGVITITSPGDCAVSVAPTTIRLVDAQNRRLAIPTSAGNPINPVVSSRDRLALSTRSQNRVGFLWSGAYCGPTAASIEITVNGKALRTPLRGSTLPCQSHATSQLIPGTADAAGQPVEPAPPAWEHLHARVLLPATIGQGPIPLNVVISNDGPKYVSLSDTCPTYIAYMTLKSAGSLTETGRPAANLCDHPYSIAPGGSLTLTLPPFTFPSTTNFPQLRVETGDLLQVTWAIAGIPSATATSRIR